MILFRYDPRKHWIPKRFEATEWLQRKFEDPLLFLYKNIEEGCWSVGQFQLDRPGFIEDILTLGEFEHPVMMALTRTKIARIDYILNGPAVDPCKVIMSMHRDNIRKLQDMNDNETGIRKWMGKNISYFDDNPLYK